MNPLDWMLAALLTYSTVRAFLQGFFREAFAVGGLDRRAGGCRMGIPRAGSAARGIDRLSSRGAADSLSCDPFAHYDRGHADGKAVAEDSDGVRAWHPEPVGWGCVRICAGMSVGRRYFDRSHRLSSHRGMDENFDTVAVFPACGACCILRHAFRPSAQVAERRGANQAHRTRLDQAAPLGSH